MFPPKTRADVGMVQCVPASMAKPPGGKTVGTRRRVGPCKEGGQLVHATRRRAGPCKTQVINMR